MRETLPGALEAGGTHICLRSTGSFDYIPRIESPPSKAKMSGEPKTEDGTLLKRVPVIVRSWDGPNSRIGLEMDLSEMPWGPFDALGKRLSLLLPALDEATPDGLTSESQVERALRHVEHAANRCAEFAQLANGNQELWLRSQETWEWIRKYLTSHWVETVIEGRTPVPVLSESPEARDGPVIPPLPGAASTLKVAAMALRATPLSEWRETMGALDPEAPTREETVQTLLGVARILSGQAPEGTTAPAELSNPHAATSLEAASSPEAAPSPEPNPAPQNEADPDQISFDFARGYDEGYQMGRRVGLALGAPRGPRPGPRKD